MLTFPLAFPGVVVGFLIILLAGRQGLIGDFSNRLFGEKRVTRASLDAATARIGAAQGELRAAHLRYHFAMIDVLSPAQVARYAELRGYDESSPHVHGTH